MSQENGCGTNFLVPQPILFQEENTMKNKKMILAAVALVVVVAIFAGVYLATRPAAQQGAVAFTVVVVHADGSEKTFEYRTDGGKLGVYLEDAGLIESEGADDGMFHTVDGEKADWNVNQSYWAFYEGEAYAMTGIYATDIVDGAVYKLVYTIG